MKAKDTRYHYPQEKWNAAKCAKLAKHRSRDSYGTLGPVGLINSFSSAYGPMYGSVLDYNGGCVIDGEWYSGKAWPMPEIPEEYEIVPVSSWGLRIQLKKTS